MTTIGLLFSDPQVKPLSTAGQFQSGAYLLFYLTGTTTPANVYQDGACTIPLSQVPGAVQPSCTADAAGRFNPIYMNPGTTYRVQMYTQSGTKIEDTDPYNMPNTTQTSPGGTNQQIQYNNSGAFGGSTFTYNSATGAYTIPAPAGSATPLTVSAGPSGSALVLNGVAGNEALVINAVPGAGLGAIVATGCARTPFVTLTYGTTVTLDCSASNAFYMLFGAGNVTTLTITNVADGQTINWIIKQDGVGTRTITWPAAFKFPGGAGAGGVLSTPANSVDILVATYNATLNIWLCSISKAFA